MSSSPPTATPTPATNLYSVPLLPKDNPERPDLYWARFIGDPVSNTTGCGLQAATLDGVEVGSMVRGCGFINQENYIAAFHSERISSRLPEGHYKINVFRIDSINSYIEHGHLESTLVVKAGEYEWQ